MCAYNAIDGAPACANNYLLTNPCATRGSSKAYVTSDCGAVGDISDGHQFAPDNEHGSAVAVQAGTDTTCGDEYVTLVKAVHDGLIKESEIDTALKRLFTARFRLGMFDPPASVAFNQIPFSEDDSPQHRKLALARGAGVDGAVEKPGRRAALQVKVQNHRRDRTRTRSPWRRWKAITTARRLIRFIPWMEFENSLQAQAKVLYSQGSPYLEELPHPGATHGVPYGRGRKHRQGLKAEYFSNTDLSGKPVLTRMDPQIQFDWDSAAPVPGVSMKAFAVRWTGTLTPPGPGDYTFSVPKPEWHPEGGEEAYRVYLDGTLRSRHHRSILPTRNGPIEDKKNLQTTFQVALRRQPRRMPSGLNMCTKPQPSELGPR